MPSLENKFQNEFDSNTSILFHLRSTAMTSRSDRYRDTARQMADTIQVAISRFNSMPTYANLADLNSLWACGHRLVTKLQPTDDPSGKGGTEREFVPKKVLAVAA
jgi:hypothetical protein